MASWTKLEIYDISGKLVATILEGWRPAGYHEVTFDGSHLGSGLYFYRIQAGDPGAGKGRSFMQTRKFLLLR